MKLPHLMRREDGMTMFEVLIVCVILGVLAAIALPSLASRDESAMDADAKSNVRNLFGHVQGCFAEQGDYTLCDEASEIGNPSGFSWGRNAGQIEIRRGSGRTNATQVTIRATSKSVTGGVRHRFTFVKRAGPPPDTRTCRSGDGNDAGGCQDGSW